MMTKSIFSLATLIVQLALMPLLLQAGTRTATNSSIGLSADSQAVGTIVSRLHEAKDLKGSTAGPSQSDSLKVGSIDSKTTVNATAGNAAESGNGGIYISVGAVIIILLLLIIIF